MNIGIDVDGVLTDLSGFILENGNKFFKGKRSVINENTYKLMDMFDCSKEEEDKFWFKYVFKYCLKAKCEKDASDVIKKLRKNGHKIYIITSRVYTKEQSIRGELFRKILEYWLKKNIIEYDEIIYCDDDNVVYDKYYACKENSIDIMIEDQMNNAYGIFGTSEVFLRTRKYNETFEQFTQVSGFKDIYSKIEERGKCKKYGCKN